MASKSEHVFSKYMPKILTRDRFLSYDVRHANFSIEGNLMSHRISRLKRSSAAALSFGVITALMTGCVAGAEPAARSSHNPPSTSAERPALHAKDETAAGLIPSPIAKVGQLRIAADGASSPDAMLADDGVTLTGWQVDLGYALSDVMGLQAKFENTSTSAIIPALENGRFDMGVATFGVTPERLKVLDFVGNFVGGTGFVTNANSKADFNSIEDLCGQSVAVVQGTLQVQAAGKQNDACIARGAKPVDIQQFPDKNAAALSLTSHRVGFLFVDSTTTGYMVKQSPDVYKEIGKKIFLGVAGIQMKKGNGLAEAVQAALQVLIKDGTYRTILSKYGVEDGAVSHATINDPNVR
jgi:polar amino acid transport system substrate-binding protein